MRRWAVLGALLGAVTGLAAFAPAHWVAGAVGAATGQRLLLADARGFWWNGSAVVVLTGGPGSRDASVLPGRLGWRLGLKGAGLAAELTQACCLNGSLTLHWRPSLTRTRVEVMANGQGPIGQWPVAWLAGLGTPWNTLQPTGQMQLSAQGLAVEWVQGRWLLDGTAQLELAAVASRVSTLEVLGHYRLLLQGDPRGQAASLQLQTVSGPLQLSGQGQWAAARWRFTGVASADPGSEAALNNLLNIIGRRQGAQSILSIG